MMVSDHARKRLKERLGDVDAEGVCEYLWATGHPPTGREFGVFRTNPVAGRDYRVARRRGVLVMVVMDMRTKRIVTVFGHGR